MEHYKNLSLKDIVINIDGIKVREIWKDVVGYEGYYAVSNFGRVKSFSRMVWTGRKHNKRKERILRQKINKYGYLLVAPQVGKIRKYSFVHTLVAKAFIKNPENKNQVNHKWGNKKDNRPSELEWMTAKENSNHAISIGIDSVVGESNGRAKLTEDQVREIRLRYVCGSANRSRSREILSKEFGVSKSIISRVAWGDSWKHVESKL